MELEELHRMSRTNVSHTDLFTRVERYQALTAKYREILLAQVGREAQGLEGMKAVDDAFPNPDITASMTNTLEEYQLVLRESEERALAAEDALREKSIAIEDLQEV